MANPSTTSKLVDTHRTTENQAARCKLLLKKLKAIQLEEMEEYAENQFETLVNNLAVKKGVVLKEAKVPDFLVKKSLPTPPPDAFEPEDFGEVKPPPVVANVLDTKHGLIELENGTQMWKKNIKEFLLSVVPLGKEDDETDSASEVEDDSERAASYRYRKVDEEDFKYLPQCLNPSLAWAKQRIETSARMAWIRDQVRLVDRKRAQTDQLLDYIRLNKPAFKFDTTARAVKDVPVGIQGSDLNLSTIALYHAQDQSPRSSSADGVSSTVGNENLYVSASHNKETTSETRDNGGGNVVGGGLESLRLKITDTPTPDPNCVARRCLPLCKPFKHRKVLQIGGIHNVVGALGRMVKEPQTLCSCFGREELCVICSGRSDKVRRIRNGAMPRQEIKALLDHTYHKVLSGSNDKPVRLLTASILKKFSKKEEGKSDDEDSDDVDIDDEDPACTKRYRGPNLIPCSRRLPPVEGTEQEEDEQREVVEYLPKQKRPVRPQRMKKSEGKRSRKRRHRYNTDEEEEDDFELEDDDDEEDGLISWSPKKSKSERRQRRMDSEKYDIDHIVIPYSIAAATRVEKIEYKEIDIPSWRIVNPETPSEEPTPPPPPTKPTKNSRQRKSGPASVHTSQEDFEDLKPETILERHKRSEEEEKQRFMKAMTMISGRRARKSESTLNLEGEFIHPTEKQAKTDPRQRGMEIELPNPHEIIIKEEPISPGLPNALTAAESSFAVSALKVGSAPVSPTKSSHRRRTISIKIEDDEIEEIGIPPWNPRRFPLSEEEYSEMVREQDDWESGKDHPAPVEII